MPDKKDFNELLDTLGDKAENLKIAAQLKGMDTHDAIKAKLSDAQSDLTAATEQARIDAEGTKSQVSSKLLQASMTLRQKKDEFDADREARKAENEQERALKDAEDAEDYADFAIRYALMAMDEARCAVLDAEDKRLDYEEQYGEE